MRTLLLMLFLGMFSVASFAQDAEGDKKAKSEKKEKKNDVPDEAESTSKDRIVLQFNFANWIKNNDAELSDLKTKWFSRGVAFHFMYDQRVTKRFSIAPGIGLNFNNIFTNSLLIRNDSSDYYGFAAIDDNKGLWQVDTVNDDWRKYKISTLHLEIPLELRIRTKPNAKGKSFKIAAGFKAGVLVDSHTKFKYQKDQERHVTKEKNIVGLQRFTYGPTFRVGYGGINVVASYTINDVFKAANGPQGINQFTVGISFNGL